MKPDIIKKTELQKQTFNNVEFIMSSIQLKKLPDMKIVSKCDMQSEIKLSKETNSKMTLILK